MCEVQDIKGFTEEALVRWLGRFDIASYRAGQILRWIYHRGVNSFDEMTDLSMDMRRFLSERLTVSRLEPERVQRSEDGTRKYCFRLQDGRCIESVLIPQASHSTLCVSSQVGCAMGCRFCLTGSGGLSRNLEPAEIINQVCGVLDDVGVSGAVTNIVFMGMGEPLANYDNVVQAIRTITANNGLQFSARRVTLSTVGLVPLFDALGRDVKVNLAVSLNAADNKTRDMLMPINRTYPLETLLAACQRFPLPSRRMITFEYVLIAGVNDSPNEAQGVAALLRPLRAKINLIPFNPYEGCDFGRPDEDAVLAFQEVLLRHNYTTIVRHSKGRDISAACGQLAGGVRPDTG